MQRKASYRLVQPAGAASASPQPPSSPRKSAALEAMDALGCMHSLAVLILGSCLLISLAPSWREWRWPPTLASTSAAASSPALSTLDGSAAEGLNATAASSASNRWWLETPTSLGQSALFCVSAVYFALDVAALQWRGRFSSSKAQRVLLHHVLTIAGLVACIVTGRDGPLVLVALVLAETSSPPWHVLQLCRHASRSSWRPLLLSPPGTPPSSSRQWLRRLLRPLLSAALSMDLTLLHVLIFLLTRLMCLQFTAHAVMPFASLLSTKIVATALVLLSACQFLDIASALWRDEGLLWKQVRSELRALQADCADDASFEGDEPSKGRRHTSAHNRGSGGGTSPRSIAAAAQVAPADEAVTMTSTSKRPPLAQKKLSFRQ